VRNHILFLTGLLFCIVLSCKKDEPILKLDKTNFNFSFSQKSNDLIISNIGDAALEWKISGLPHWLKVNSINGTLKSGTTVLTFTAEDFDLDDDKSGSFELMTNGGNETIKFKLSINLLVPGIGTKYVYLNIKYSDLISLAGAADYIDVVPADETGEYNYRVFSFINGNMSAYFLKNSTNMQLHPTDSVCILQFFYPNDVYTNKWIGLGSSISDVQLAYGNTDYYDWYLSGTNHIVNFHSYLEYGIEFYFIDNDYLSVQCISIFPPIEITEQSIPKALIDARKNQVNLSKYFKEF
jgi:hypothetical protein